MKNKIIAVDFDGTLCEDKFPDIGADRTEVIEKLKKEQAAGARTILWTCRRGERLIKAIYWCLDRGITFDAVNDNLNAVIDNFGGDTRKIYADEYWDDKAVLPFEREKIAERDAPVIDKLMEVLKTYIDTNKACAARIGALHIDGVIAMTNAEAAENLKELFEAIIEK